MNGILSNCFRFSLITLFTLFFAEPVCAGSCKNSKQENVDTASYQFEKTISRQVLENYLSRAITMQNLLIAQGDFNDNLRMLKNTGAKYIGRSVCQWGGEENLLQNLSKEKVVRFLPLVSLHS